MPRPKVDLKERKARRLQERSQHAAELRSRAEYWTPAEIAEAYGFNPQTIRRFYREGRLKGKKIGNLTFFHLSAIHAFFGSEKKAPTTRKGKRK